MTEPVVVNFLRHGMVDGPQNVFRGRSDLRLSAEGHEQMQASILAMGLQNIDAVVSSPSRRCAEFAENFSRQQGVPLTIDPGFAEMDFGSWEEKTLDEAAASDPLLFEKFRENPEQLAPPAGEAFAAFSKRVRQALASLLAEAKGGNRLVITHAGVMRLLFMEAMGLPAKRFYQLALPLAANFSISYMEGESPILLSLNRMPCAD